LACGIGTANPYRSVFISFDHLRVLLSLQEDSYSLGITGPLARLLNLFAGVCWQTPPLTRT